MSVPSQAAGEAASLVDLLEIPPALLLDQILDSSVKLATGKDAAAGAAKRSSDGRSLREFLNARTVGKALQVWLGRSGSDLAYHLDAEQLSRRLRADIAHIDGLLNDQVNAILHHPKFQKLESSWRGLQYLTKRLDEEADRMIKVRFLDVSWREVERDFERAIEFDQSLLFKKIYSEQIGTPGGQPFGLMIGDYAIRHRISVEHPHDDVATLSSMAAVAAAAFCPFLCAADPELLGMDSFSDLQISANHAKRFRNLEYLKWNALRESEDSRFVGVLLPRILMRAPYLDDGSRIDRFIFAEDVSAPDTSGHLWGNPGYAYAGVVMRAFATSGWLADIRGLRQDEDGGGLVSDLPALNFPSDQSKVILRSVTEMTVTDRLERELSEMGLIPLCDCKNTPMAVFASGQTLQKPKTYNEPRATANAKISAMMPYMLTCSRFAHYLKVMARDKIGSIQDADEIERYLHDWLMDYVTSDRESSALVKSRRPLQAGSVRVRADTSNPGAFRCIIRLAPHYELDELAGSIKLSTTLMSD